MSTKDNSRMKTQASILESFPEDILEVRGKWLDEETWLVIVGHSPFNLPQIGTKVRRHLVREDIFALDLDGTITERWSSWDKRRGFLDGAPVRGEGAVLAETRGNAELDGAR